MDEHQQCEETVVDRIGREKIARRRFAENGKPVQQFGGRDRRELGDLIRSFRDMRKSLILPDFSKPFVRFLYATYLSYLPTDQFAYPLKMNVDRRGSFTEFVRTSDRG